MIRTSKLTIKYANVGKITRLNYITEEMTKVINLYINILWKQKVFNSKFVKIKVDTWLSACMQQAMGKQALEIIKSQRKKKRITKKFNNKLQRWSYSKVLDKLSRLTEENGVVFSKISPAYTSQKCSLCGNVDKKNRKGEIYQCSCGNLMDADQNAAINILHIGGYSPDAIR